MFMWRNLSIAALIFVTTVTAQAQPQTYSGIGRAATPAEVAAWDIDVRADFKGLPAGAGSVAKGNEVWDTKCASCHGVFGESNQVFPPLVGGTTPQDMVTGRVAAMINGTAPYRTTLMKVSQLSTLWDYINRAMPWTAPKSLSTQEVYAVTAYLLNLGGIVADNFVLSDQNIAQVQATMPNRLGKTTQHGLWDVAGNPDVNALACTDNCGDGLVISQLPDFARNAHGNLAEQNRTVGPYRGIDTSKTANTKVADTPPLTNPAAAALVSVRAPVATPIAAPSVAIAENKAATVAAPSAPPKPAVDVKPILSKNSCTACHGMTNKIVGPAFSDISKKHAGKADSVSYLAAKIKQGGQGVWGAIPMPAQALSDADAKAVAQWLVNGMK
jgi:S-disulfanyl-L-cysteine oxidoreductase SoxD